MFSQYRGTIQSPQNGQGMILSLFVRRTPWLAAHILVLVLISGLWTYPCFAGPPLRLTLEHCDNLALEEVERILLIELGSKRAEEGSVLVTEVTIECGTNRNIITVQDPITRKVLRRAIRLESTEAEGHARLLALAASELLLASWAELESNPRPTVEPDGPIPSLAAILEARNTVISRRSRSAVQEDASLAGDDDIPDVVQLSTRERKALMRSNSRIRVVGLATGRTIVGVPGMLYGGGIRAGQDRSSIASWTLDALMEGGSVGAYDALLGLTAVTVAGTVGLSYKIGAISMRAGGGLRWGITSVRSGGEDSKDVPSVVTIGPWGWPMTHASLTVHTGNGLLAELGMEAGYAVIPVGGSNSGVAAPALQGAWVGASFGLGFGP